MERETQKIIERLQQCKIPIPQRDDGWETIELYICNCEAGGCLIEVDFEDEYDDDLCCLFICVDKRGVTWQSPKYMLRS
jgi:hypothetical protein